MDGMEGVDHHPHERERERDGGSGISRIGLFHRSLRLDGIGSLGIWAGSLRQQWGGRGNTKASIDCFV